MGVNYARLEETEDALEDKALFCLKTGMAPSEYDNLTDRELAAFVKVFNRLAEEQ